ncbi:MAG: hypothetical protein EPO52_17240 [Herbiconiux sp.]|uniref:hypothetical protein n=1 Tax=Herbiconiux sp. TaxID=1871186 RepID=UPI001204363D|nr:hypothetical protein [Herbiconiux sp.]TAJ46282.1 MAG: hypothetical protein EPO52_17240 [Herbiconiux sp.]
MGSSVKDLIINILADDKTGSTIDGVGGKLDKLNKGISRGATATILGTVAIGAAAVDAGMAMDGAYDTIQQSTGATGASLDGLKGSFDNVFTNAPVDIGLTATAIAELNQRTGLTGPGLEKLTTQVLLLGDMAGQGEVDINGLTGATSLFQIPAEGMSDALDQLFGISQATGVSVNDLTAGVGANGSALKGLGFSLVESAQLVGTLDKAGVDATAVTTGMSKGFKNLALAGEEPQEAFRRVVGEIGGFLAAGDQAAAFDLAGKVFGARGSTEFIGALQTGALNLDSITAAAGAANSSIIDMAESTADFPEKWTEFENKARSALAEVGEKLIPVITSGFDKLMPVIDLAADNIDVVLGFGTALAAGAVAVKGYEGLQAIAGVVGFFRTAQVAATAATTANTAATVANNVAWYANPVTWIVLGIIAAIAGLVVAGIWLVQNWEGVSKWLGEAAQNIANGFSGAVGFVTDLFLNWNVIGLLIKNWEPISKWFSDWWGTVVNNVNWGVQEIGKGVDGIVGFFTEIPNRVGDAWNGLVDLVAGAMINIMNFTIDTWNNTLGGLEFDMPWFLGGAHIAFPRLQSVPALAEGGIVTAPTFALIGEAGPEAVVPLSQYNRGGSDEPILVEQHIELKIDGHRLYDLLATIGLKRK